MSKVTKENIPHIVTDNKHQIVFCVKYNRKIFRDTSLEECVLEAFKKAEEKHGKTKEEVHFIIDKAEVFEDHVELVVSCDPRFGIHNAVTKLKRGAARSLRDFDPSLSSRLPSIWTHQTYYKTVGIEGSREEIDAYVESQKG